MSVLQFLLDLSDRDAAEAVRFRIDLTYTLGPELDDPGFHHSVLGDFRDRLLQDGRADRLLDLALARLKAAGLVRERTTQRTDSTHVWPCPGHHARPDPPGAGHRGHARSPGGTPPTKTAGLKGFARDDFRIDFEQDYLDSKPSRACVPGEPSVDPTANKISDRVKLGFPVALGAAPSTPTGGSRG
ncbi:transposase [Nonomuraea wenchangensis]